MAGDYVLNTLLVVSLVCLSFFLFVCYSRQPRLGLATYSLFVSLVIVASPRLGLATYSLFIVASPRLGLATYSLFASLVYLFVLLSVSRLTQKRLRLGLRNFACCLLMCFSRSLLILVHIGER